MICSSLYRLFFISAPSFNLRENSSSDWLRFPGAGQHFPTSSHPCLGDSIHFGVFHARETFALTGHGGMIVGIAPDSGSVTFAIYSWGLDKADPSGRGQSASKSDAK